MEHLIKVFCVCSMALLIASGAKILSDIYDGANKHQEAPFYVKIYYLDESGEKVLAEEAGLEEDSSKDDLIVEVYDTGDKALLGILELKEGIISYKKFDKKTQELLSERIIDKNKDS